MTEKNQRATPSMGEEGRHSGLAARGPPTDVRGARGGALPASGGSGRRRFGPLTACGRARRGVRVLKEVPEFQQPQNCSTSRCGVAPGRLVIRPDAGHAGAHGGRVIYGTTLFTVMTGGHPESVETFSAHEDTRPACPVQSLARATTRKSRLQPRRPRSRRGWTTPQIPRRHSAPRDG